MRYLCLLSVAFLAYAPTLYCYRFVCNGILANGTTRGDTCGPCNEEMTARWENPNVPVVVDYKTLPEGLSENDWRLVVKNSLAAWNSVSGSNFRFVPLEAKSLREFGVNKSFHEIFWITDVEEWRMFIGTGEFGTLGATMPRYTCGGSQGPKRIIEDADLALNGLGYINWQLECDHEDCISPQTTLVHELGHFLGLDHPCLQCNTSIMSARAGNDLKYPMVDDMEGLRVLYPSGERGGFGFPCEKNSDCSGPHICAEDKDNKYCSLSCLSDDDCADGTLCKLINDQKVCAFIDAGNKLEGENCSRVPCVDSLVCAGTSVEHSYCFAPCANGAPCLMGQECVKLKGDNVSICVHIKKKGESCFDSELCDSHLYCVYEYDNEEAGICRSPCQSVDDNSTGCPEGEHCELVDREHEMCMPAAGSLSLGVSSDSFGPDRAFGRIGKERFGLAKSGCHTGPAMTNSLNLLLGFLLLFGGWRSRTRQARKI